MITVKRSLRIERTTHGRKRLTKAPKTKPVLPGCVPRISKLMALAIRMDEMLRTGEVDDVFDLARLGHITQPRVTQILNLTLLAPDIQEALLFLPRVTAGRAPFHEKMLRPIAAEVDFAKQREMWRSVHSEPQT
jgi:hypothetical protein